MNFDLELLYGIYELEKIESTVDGKITSEHAKSGMFVFTRENRLSVVSGSNNWVMAYTGSFQIKDDILFIKTESCVVREQEDTTITRKILKLDKEYLMLESKRTGQQASFTHLTWKKKISL